MRVFSIGDIHSYNKRHIEHIRSLMHIYHPDLILSVGDFPHDQQDLSDFRFVSYFVPGNHELLQSSSALNNIMYDGRFICNNLKLDGFLPFKEDSLALLKNKQLKVRIFGMTYFPEEEKKAMLPRYSVDPIQEAINNTMQRIQYLDSKYGPPNFTIGLTHIGIANDVMLFDRLTSQTAIPKDRLLIVGGHNHIINPRLNVSRRTPIVHSGTNMQAIGIIDIDFHADGTVTTKAENKQLGLYTNRPVPTESINADGSLNKDIEAKSTSRSPVILMDNKEEYDDTYLPYNIDYASLDYFHVNKLGAWFTKRLSEIIHSDITLVNGGTLREALDKRYTVKTAAITAERIIPFHENKIITFKATAEQVKVIIQREIDLLNKTSGEYDIGTLNNKLYFQVAGIKYNVLKQPNGKYILDTITFDDPTKEEYTVATVDFLWHAYNMEDIFGVNNYHPVGGATQLMEEILQLDDLSVPPGIYEIKRILRPEQLTEGLSQ